MSILNSRFFAFALVLFGAIIGAAHAGEPAPTATDVTLLQILSYGWQINLVLCVMLFIALFLTFHTLLLTRRSRAAPENLSRALLDDIVNGEFENAFHSAQNSAAALGAAAVAGLRLHGHTAERVGAAMESAGRRALSTLRQEINYLAHIGTLSPMLGLLGTVLGLTKAFNAMGADSAEGLRSTMMTAYIGEALGTTVVGLFVGIPAMAAYFVLLSRFNRFSDELEAAAEEIAAAIAETN
jgi:biopolymer transport protein ExbB